MEVVQRGLGWVRLCLVKDGLRCSIVVGEEEGQLHSTVYSVGEARTG